MKSIDEVARDYVNSTSIIFPEKAGKKRLINHQKQLNLF